MPGFPAERTENAERRHHDLTWDETIPPASPPAPAMKGPGASRIPYHDGRKSPALSIPSEIPEWHGEHTPGTAKCQPIDRTVAAASPRVRR